MQPGQTIAPGSHSNTAEAKRENKQSSADQKPKAKQPQSQGIPPKKTDASTAKPEADSLWQYKGNDDQAPNDSEAPAASTYVQPISWTASEYVAHQKGASWFVSILFVVAVLVAVVYFVTRDVVSASVIGIIGILFVIFAARRPQVLEYSIDGTGIHVGQKTYPYGQFRSFSVLEDEAVPTIMFMPMRRLGLPLSIHFDPDDSEKILDILGSHLPGEEREAPPVDRLMNKIRF